MNRVYSYLEKRKQRWQVKWVSAEPEHLTFLQGFKFDQPNPFLLHVGFHIFGIVNTFE